jgi:hypothetical protein
VLHEPRVVSDVAPGLAVVHTSVGMRFSAVAGW